MFHEFGHFLAARLTGMRVEEFAFGFGPKLLRLFKLGDTEYTIHPIPAGGFVKIAGMEPGEENIADGFQAQAIWKRALVIFSGPFASFVLAVIIFLLVGVSWGFLDESRTLNKVLMVNPKTVAAKAGLRAGDTILEIDGTKITDGTQMIDAIHGKPGKPISLKVEHDGKIQKKTVVPAWSIEYLGASWSFMDPRVAVAAGVTRSSAAEKAGIKSDDKLISINGERIQSGAEMVAAIKRAGRKPVRLELERNTKPITAQVTPKLQWVQHAGTKWYFPGPIAFPTTGASKPAHGLVIGDQLISIDGKKIRSAGQMIRLLDEHSEKTVEMVVKRDKELKVLEIPGAKAESGLYDAVGLLGFTPQHPFVKMGFSRSIHAGLERFGYLIVLLINSLAPDKIGQSVGGPVMIANQTATMVALGPYYVVQMTGMLSLSLAFMNILPIPVLDGGHLAILAVEAIRRRRLTMEQMQTVQLVGLVLIGMLVVFVLFSDIAKITGGQIPQ